MSSRFLIAAGLAGACVAWGCSSDGSDDNLLDYRSSGGLVGHGDGSELHVDVSRRAERVTRTGGSERFTLDADTFTQLRDKIDAAQFAQLAPEYGCSCADALVDVVSVQLHGQTYDVAAASDAQVPPQLVDLIAFIHDVIEQRQ
jgi:hypothetical protein